MFITKYDTTDSGFKPFYGMLISKGDAVSDPNYGYWHIGFHWGHKIWKLHFQPKQ